MVLKWEKNEAVKVQFKNYAEEYMLRAEKIKKMLEEPVEAKPKKAALSEGDKDKNKMRETVMEAIVQEKPNVTWDDIAGLEQVMHGPLKAFPGPPSQHRVTRELRI